jgi:hypothetical protein
MSTFSFEVVSAFIASEGSQTKDRVLYLSIECNYLVIALKTDSHAKSRLKRVTITQPSATIREHVGTIRHNIF